MKILQISSWSDSLLNSLNSWLVWAGVIITLVGLVATTCGVVVTRELSRRDEIKAAKQDLQLEDALREAKEARETAGRVEEMSRPKPIKLRLREFLAGLYEIGPQIISGLEQSAEESITVRAEMELHKASEFRSLCSEAGASNFVTILPTEGDDSMLDIKDTPTGTINVQHVRFRLSKALLDESQ